MEISSLASSDFAICGVELQRAIQTSVQGGNDVRVTGSEAVCFYLPLQNCHLLLTNSRVCREDLHSPASSRSPSPDLPDPYAIDALRNVFARDTFTAPEATPDTNLEHTKNDESAEQEFEFRLFRAPAPKDAGTTSSTDPTQSQTSAGVQKLKVRLRSPTPVPPGDGSFVVPFRGWDYYLSDPEAVMRVLNGKAQEDGVQVVGSGKSRLKDEFVDAAVSGETVFVWSKTSWVCRVRR